MKKIYALCTLLLILLSTSSYSQDTIFFQFNNAQVVSGPTNDTLVFDMETRSNTSTTYLTAVGLVINYSTTAFGSSILPVAHQKLELTNLSGYNLFTEPEVAGSDAIGYTITAFPGFPPHIGGFNILFLGNVTTEYKGVARYKMLITGTGPAGIEFDFANMTGQQFYVLTSGGSSSSAYTVVIFENDLLDFPTTLPIANLMFSELADPSDSNGDFIEIYNPEDQVVSFGATSYFLTRFDGVNYDNVQLSGSIQPGETFVIGGPNFASAYPGKTADMTASFVESNGTDIFYLTANQAYDAGTLIDLFDASSVSFTGKHAVRPYPHTDPNTTFSPGEWSVTSASTMDMTPGSHRAALVWDGSSDDTWKDTANWTPSYVPDAGHNADIPLDAPTLPLVNTGTTATCYDFMVGGAIPPGNGMKKDEITRFGEDR